MSRNSIGKNVILTSFGESHGPFIGAVLDGFPSNYVVDEHFIQIYMGRRKPGQSAISTSRAEKDAVSIISGVFNGITTGSPITFLIENTDARPADYEQMKDVFRAGHGDLLYKEKYGHHDYRGGGRGSARITAGWVAAGALAIHYLQQTHNIHIRSWVKQIYTIDSSLPSSLPSIEMVDSNMVRCPDAHAAQQMIQAIEEAKMHGDSLGGIIHTQVHGMPVGIGEPVFGKLQSVLAQYIMSINAVKGISIGEGFNAAAMKGSQHNDQWIYKNDDLGTLSNHAGGMVGGMSTGEPIVFETAFKPTSSISIPQKTVNSDKETVPLTVTGRHDPCVVPRAVPIVEAMTALAMLDLILENK
jgi:chorismate synthase